VGNRSANVAPGEAYKTRDGVWLFIAVTGDTIFRRAMIAIGRQDLADDPVMANNAGRLANRDALDGALADWVARHDRDDVLRTMSEAEVSISPVNSIADLFADPHVQARGDFVEIDDARLGKMRMQGTFPKLSNTPGSIRRSAPRIGEPTDEILSDELGFTGDEVAELRSTGVIG
jgi:crotonobetainyl-CoA:carnitine CoA-transferase CaiB-like acyl-CoA transferase